MNEVTRIHLGRQPFTISVEAHRALKAYLSEIKKQVGDEDVANEVELRMAELLQERGIEGEKVVLPEDVDFIKQQLGDPDEFSDDEAVTSAPASDNSDKRLFRDTDNALIAGVSAGIGNYFGIDSALVRLLFILLAIFGGGIGILIYAVLWLAVPPATTASEKLQMRGAAVNLGSLKDSVSKADLSGTTRRASNSISRLLNGVFRVLIKLLGIGFILAGFTLIITIVVTKIYMMLHHGKLFEENLFPVGYREHLLVTLAMMLGVIVAIFLILAGIASLKRKWPVRAWVTGVLAGLFVLGTAGAIALAADAAPRVEQRYQESVHTTGLKNIQPFNKVVSTGSIDLSYVSAPDYAVNVHYNGNPDLSKIKTEVKDGILYVDSSQLGNKKCTMLCLFPGYNMTLQIYAPNVEDFQTPPNTDIFYPNPPALP